MKREFCFLRHGEARPRKETNTMNEFIQDELIRELTEKGRSEIEFLGDFDLVVTSPAWRTIETARFASARNPDRIIIPLSTHLWPSVNDNKDWELVEKVFVWSDYNSLEEVYVASTEDEIRACERITKQAVEEIANLIYDHKRILIVGHALHLQAVADRMFGEDVKNVSREQIRKIVLGIGQYFFIVV